MVNLFVVILFIIVALCFSYVFRFFYRYNLKVKAENLERDRIRENEVIQQYSKIKDEYFSSLKKLKSEPNNVQLKKYTIEKGQRLIEFTIQHKEYYKVISFDENDLLNDLPGRTDPLFIEALQTCIDLKSIDKYLLANHLQIGFTDAERILDAMFEEGFVGERDWRLSTNQRPVITSSLNRLKRRIEEAREKEKKENEIFQVELLRLSNSDDYKYINQFTKKYGRNISASELAKLRDLLNIRGFEFSDKQMTDIVNLALNQKRYRDAKSKILNEEPNEVQDIVKFI